MAPHPSTNPDEFLNCSGNTNIAEVHLLFALPLAFRHWVRTASTLWYEEEDTLGFQSLGLVYAGKANPRAGLVVGEYRLNLGDDLIDSLKALREAQEAVILVLKADQALLVWIALGILLFGLGVQPIGQLGDHISHIGCSQLLDGLDQALTDVASLDICPSTGLEELEAL